MNLPTEVLEELIDDQIMRQEAQRRDIVVSQEEVEVRLEEQFGYDRNPPTPMPTPITSTLPITVTPTPTTVPMTFEQFTERTEDWFRTTREATGFNEADFRRLLESSLYREKVSEALRAEAPTTAEQIHAQHILVATREEAELVLERLANGEAFEDLAAELSQDESNKEQGGDLGWFGRGRMVAEFEQVAFDLEPGETSEIVETQFGFHIIRVIERDANRTLEGSDLSQAQNQYVEDWLNQRRDSPDVVRSLDSMMVPTEIPTRAPQRR
ncbi:MAG: peptidylprolyl isomerase [Anaerolineae bacterium]|nr:peptidylprolyl isomerase [Anaerolineae bacterium]